MHAICYEMYHRPPFLLIGLLSIGRKCKLIDFNHCNLMHLLWQFILMYPFSLNLYFVGVPSGAVVKIWCASRKERTVDHCTR
jgi:hypothetical protein